MHLISKETECSEGECRFQIPTWASAQKGFAGSDARMWSGSLVGPLNFYLPACSLDPVHKRGFVVRREAVV